MTVLEQLFDDRGYHEDDREMIAREAARNLYEVTSELDRLVEERDDRRWEQDYGAVKYLVDDYRGGPDVAWMEELAKTDRRRLL